jgi:DNA repair protein RadC
VLAHATAAVLLFHNHPSGVCTPSHADELITRGLRDALALIEVRLLDHLVVSEEVYSFAESGLL